MLSNSMVFNGIAPSAVEETIVFGNFVPQRALAVPFLGH
jgi:hypothetical protein